MDINSHACKSLKLNHPETEVTVTFFCLICVSIYILLCHCICIGSLKICLKNNKQVRNEAAEDFLSLLKEWEKLCTDFSLVGTKHDFKNAEEDEEVDNDDNDGVNSSEEFEVQKLLAVCYGDPNQAKKPGLYFKVSQCSFCIYIALHSFFKSLVVHVINVQSKTKRCMFNSESVLNFLYLIYS